MPAYLGSVDVDVNLMMSCLVSLNFTVILHSILSEDKHYSNNEFVAVSM